MSIIARKDKQNKPRYIVRINTRDPETGKRVWHNVGTYRTKKEAAAEERKAIEQRNRGTLLDPAKTTIEELLDSWLSTKAGDVTPQTLKGYEITVRRYLKPALGSNRVQALTPARLQAQYAMWTEGGMSARNLRGCHMRLSQALAQAVRFRLVQTNVCDVVSPPKLKTSRPEVWDTDEAMTFLDKTKSDAMSPLWHFLLLEGMRRGEGLGLRWKDINWERGTAHIIQTVAADISSRGEPIILARTKTAAGARTVKLSSATLALLKDHRKAWAERKIAAETWADHDLIVCTSKGTPINPNNVTRSFDLIVKRAGVRRITPHGLRHTHATMLLKQGVPAKIVSERLGHASVGITLDRYSHLVGDMQDTAADAIDRIMASGNASA